MTFAFFTRSQTAALASGSFLRSMFVLTCVAVGLQAVSSATRAASASELEQKGEYLARAGNCVSCHSSETGRPFAGGLAFETPFGTVYSTNITPDVATGIGDWTLAQFSAAMRQGGCRHPAPRRRCC